MRAVNDLTQGPIFSKIMKLSLPVMGSSLLQMIYPMLNSFWLGKLGSGCVAAVGAAAFFTWFVNAMIIGVRLGSEVGVSQSVGRKNYQDAFNFATNGLWLTFFMCVVFNIIIFFAAPELLSLLEIKEVEVFQYAVTYLKALSFSVIFFNFSVVATAIYTGMGNTKTPFMINSLGFILNMILSPFLIYGIGFFPALGIAGAGISTSFSFFVSFCLFLFMFERKASPLRALSKDGLSLISSFKNLSLIFLKKIVRLGFPASVQNMLFCFFSATMAKLLVSYGAISLAVQNIGFQIEALTWLTVGGFASSLSSFTGQNFGAGKFDRVKEGYRISLIASISIALFATALFFFGGDLVTSLFLKEPEAIAIGIIFFKIMAAAQIFMCIEIVSSGSLNGMGKTLIAPVVSIIFNGARIPMAIFLCSFFGVYGIWWSVTISNTIKGLILLGAVIFVFKKKSSLTKTVE